MAPRFSLSTAANGSVLLCVTKDVFDARSPAHVAGAQFIADAVRPLNVVLTPL